MHTKYAVAVSALVFAVTAWAETVTEPKTEQSFSATIEHNGATLECTGTTYRSKFFFKAYAFAHYGALDEAPETDNADKLLQYWIEAKAPKAIHLKLVRDISASQMRDAIEDAFDEVGYTGEPREVFLTDFAEDYPEGSEVLLVANAKNTLRGYRKGKLMGEWEDAELIHALWQTWLGEDTVLEDRENVVARQVEMRNAGNE